ncbi:SHOCT domain-containing protein [Streptomyces sp. NPDC059874]|uniref:SHOCT domain-containing protein n=1 Tax=Streptomyces sp. NPDC059874 TaxID=3346983 RepID=UPI00366A539D
MFIRPVGVTVRSADRPAGHPLLRGLLARATGTDTGTVDVDEPRHGVRWRTTGPIEPEPVEWEAEEPEPVGPEPVEPEAVRPAPSPEPEPGHPEGVPAGELVAELTQLAALAQEGLLTPEEFTTAKGRLLRG